MRFKPTPEHIDLSRIGDRAMNRREELCDTPYVVRGALDLARAMLTELEMADVPEWCTYNHIDQALGCASHAAEYLHDNVCKIVGEDARSRGHRDIRVRRRRRGPTPRYARGAGPGALLPRPALGVGHGLIRRTGRVVAEIHGRGACTRPWIEW